MVLHIRQERKRLANDRPTKASRRHFGACKPRTIDDSSSSSSSSCSAGSSLLPFRQQNPKCQEPRQRSQQSNCDIILNKTHYLHFLQQSPRISSSIPLLFCLQNSQAPKTSWTREPDHIYPSSSDLQATYCGQIRESMQQIMELQFLLLVWWWWWWSSYDSSCRISLSVAAVDPWDFFVQNDLSVSAVKIHEIPSCRIPLVLQYTVRVGLNSTWEQTRLQNSGCK